MGHKVHPTIHRTPFIYGWDSKWFAKKELLPDYLRQEIRIRELLRKKLKDAGIAAVSIERTAKEVLIIILVAKPGVVIGRSGQGLEAIRKEIERTILRFQTKVKLNIQAVDNPALSAQIVGQSMAIEIERRIPFRRVMKQAMEKVMSAGAQGVKLILSGRLNGVEIARRESMSAGKMSLITLRSDVDYAFTEAHTIYGKIGIKVWVYHGEVFGPRDKFAKREETYKTSHSGGRGRR